MLRVPWQNEATAARASSVVVVGRIRAIEEFWRSGSVVADGVRLGTSCVVDLLRFCAVGQTAALDVRGGTSLTWEPGAPLGEPLERLGWRSGEPVILAVPTPGIVGGTVPLRIQGSPEAPDSSSSGRSATVDTRERVREARWRGRERFLETARRFFGCSLERIVVWAEDIHEVTEEGSEGSVRTMHQCLLKHLDGTLEISDVPADLPETQRVLLPLMMGELFRTLPGRVGLVILEEDQLTYVLWIKGQMQFLRSFPLGAGLLLSHLMRTLDCSPQEGGTLLAQAEGGTLSLDAQRLLTKTLQPILPLFRGAWRMVEEELSDHPRPTRCMVAGYWPTVFLRLLTKTAFQSRCLSPAATLRILPNLPHAVRADAGSRAVLSEPALRLLDVLAHAVRAHRVAVAALI